MGAESGWEDELVGEKTDGHGSCMNGCKDA